MWENNEILLNICSFLECHQVINGDNGIKFPLSTLSIIVEWFKWKKTIVAFFRYLRELFVKEKKLLLYIWWKNIAISFNFLAFTRPRNWSRRWKRQKIELCHKKFLIQSIFPGWWHITLRLIHKLLYYLWCRNCQAKERWFDWIPTFIPQRDPKKKNQDIGERDGEIYPRKAHINLIKVSFLWDAEKCGGNFFQWFIKEEENLG